MKKNLDICLKEILVITNIFCQSLGPSLYRGSTGGNKAGNTEKKLENSVYIIR